MKDLRPRVKIDIKEKAKEKVNDDSTGFNINNYRGIRVVARALVYGLTLIVCTFASSKLFDYRVIVEAWYWIGVVAVLGIALVRLIKNESSINIPYKLCIIAVAIAVSMIGITSIDPRYNLKYGIDYVLGKTDEISIPAGATLYIIKNDTFVPVKNINTEMKVKKIGWEKSDTNEVFYQVQLSKDGNYVGGETYFVPARFCKSVPAKLNLVRNETSKSSFDVIPGPGHYVYEVTKGDETNWKAVPKHLYWSLSAKQKGDWDLVPFTGKVITFEKDKDQLADITGLDNTFKIKNKGDDMVFDLVVKPRI